MLFSQYYKLPGEVTSLKKKIGKKKTATAIAAEKHLLTLVYKVLLIFTNK
jgi:hypothetical protein